MSFFSRFWMLAAVGVTLLLLYLPLLGVVVHSFNSAQRGMSWESFSFHWYGQFLADPESRLTLLRSIIVAVLSGAISLVFGTVIGCMVANADGATGRAGLWLLLLPAIVPDLVLALTYSAVFTLAQLPKGILSVALGQASFGISYVGLFVVIRWRSLPMTGYRLAAQSLGLDRSQFMARIALPLISPASVAGGMVVATMAIQDFVFAFFCGSATSTTLSMRIYGMVKFGVTASANVAYVLLAALAFAIYFLSETVRSKLQRNP